MMPVLYWINRVDDSPKHRVVPVNLLLANLDTHMHTHELTFKDCQFSSKQIKVYVIA